MAVFHQMGHHSRNLVDLPEMAAYAGAIFSPINCSQQKAAEEIGEVRSTKKQFQLILDPQLYVPASKRGHLKTWKYIPKDFETADKSSSVWWSGLSGRIADVCRSLKFDAVCSPVLIPRAFDNQYYSQMVEVGTELARSQKGSNIHVLQTVLASLNDLGVGERSLELASIISRTEAERVYLVIDASTNPRREMSDVDGLVGVMRLINALERNGVPVLVAFSSQDLILWKAAGASECASGKFFNLRRFTPQRFEDEAETGGGALPNWFEESLLAFLRQGDLLRVRKHGLISEASKQNPFSQQVLAIIDEARRTGEKQKAWLGIGWRQFLYWFADVEARLTRKEVTTETLLSTANSNWGTLDEAKIFMEDRRNDGTWVRDWLNALHEYQAHLQ